MKRLFFALWAMMVVIGGSVRADDEVALSRVVVFGDSLSDTGNLSTLTGGIVASPPYFNGRLSNGPVWVERLVDELGLPAPDPVLLGGTNYAFSGAQAGPGLTGGFIPNIEVQVEEFLLKDALDGNELIVLWAGANNAIVDAFDVFRNEPVSAAETIVHCITTLAAAGGKLFLVPNSHPLGEIPWFRDSFLRDLLDHWSIVFNKRLAAALREREGALGITILLLDSFKLFNDIFDNPEDFNLTNVTDPACANCNTVSGREIVSNPDEYFFWDGAHPSRMGHLIIGDAAVELVRRQ